MLHKDDIEVRHFFYGLVFLGLVYLIFEFFFNAYALLSVDEFWFAHRIYEYKSGLPYRDFAPYKTVLGYYLLLLPMLFTKGIFSTLIIIKNTIAIFNSIIMVVCAHWLTRFFTRIGIFLSLFFLLFSDLFLTYSTNIRVDLMGYWFCLLSFLFLLDKRYFFAGLMLGLGFITTQKAIWYWIASNAALGIYGLMYRRDLKSITKIILFNLITLSVIVVYIGIWAGIAGFETVINSMFREAAVMYHLDSYVSHRKLYWYTILIYNPLLFLLAPLTFMSLFVTYVGDSQYQTRLFCVVYALSLLAMLLPYKQVFPYYMQVTIPIFFVLYSAFFSWLLKLVHMPTKTIVSLRSVWIISFLYILLMFLVTLYFALPKPYLLICIIPILISFCMTPNAHRSQTIKTISIHLIFISFVFVGGIYPGILLVSKIFNMNGRYQRANVNAIDDLLMDGSDYVAGIELIYNKNQPIPGMRHLGLDAINYLYAPSQKLRPMMMASLYGDPHATIASVIDDWQKSSVKLYVNNYRMMAIPPRIKAYLESQYEHFWGSIYLYSPIISYKKNNFKLKFSGNYLIEGDHDIILNNKTYQAHSLHYLVRGNYHLQSQVSFRLKLIPAIRNQLLEFNQDEWVKMMY